MTDNVRRFDILKGGGEYHHMVFTTPEQMAEWMVAHGISTTIVKALWYFPDVQDWIQVESSFVRNAKVQP